MFDYEMADRLFSANFETGKLYWKERTADLFNETVGRSAEHACKQWNSRCANKEAGYVDKSTGYCEVRLFKTGHKLHRIIWLLATKEWPKEHIDHINGIKDDNRLVNLREVSYNENNRNARKRSDNKSGFVGVYFHKPNQSWLAYIRANGKKLHLGYYEKIEDAIAVRKAAEIEHGYHPNHGRD